MPRTGQWRGWLAAAWRGMADLIWPPLEHCALCRAPVTASPDPLPVCTACLGQMVFPTGLHRCSVCQRPLRPAGPGAALLRRSAGTGARTAPAVCGECDTPHRPFIQVMALGLYQEPLRTAVLQLKFKGHTNLALPLGRHLALALNASDSLPAFAAVVPVPLHPARLRQRGFNQAERLAMALAAALGVPVRAGWLARHRPTAAQSDLDRWARLQNLAGAFRSKVSSASAGPVLLVDDVLTTGATIWAAASALRQGGVTEVYVAVLAVNDLPVAPTLRPEWYGKGQK